MIDMEIMIKFPVTFQKPLGSGMSDEILEKSGQTKLGVNICGDDTVHYWKIKERYPSHVMVEGIDVNYRVITLFSPW